MDCEALRERLNQDPEAARDEFTQHARSCPACAAYGRRAAAAEQLIQRALEFDVGALRTGMAVPSAPAPTRGLTGGHGAATRTGRWVGALAAAAGMLVGALAVWFVLAPTADLGAERLAVEVVQHWFEEPGSWTRSETVVTAATLATVLDGKADIDLTAIGRVSYARSCFVAGQWVPHLVVQGEAGPFMVLLMPEQSLQSPVRLTLDEQGLEGHALPVGGGSIAVLGVDGEEAVVIEQAVAGAVEWTI